MNRTYEHKLAVTVTCTIVLQQGAKEVFTWNVSMQSRVGLRILITSKCKKFQHSAITMYQGCKAPSIC